MGSGDVIPPENLATGTPDGTLFLRDDGVWASPGAGSGGMGTTTVDFGSNPGRSMASVDVPIGAIGSGSLVQAWIMATATVDHGIDEHWVETLKVVPGNVVAGVGFSINVECLVGRTTGLFTVAYRWS